MTRLMYVTYTTVMKLDSAEFCVENTSVLLCSQCLSDHQRWNGVLAPSEHVWLNQTGF